MEAGHKNPWKIASFALLSSALLVGLFAWSIESAYIYTLPREPNSAIGRVFPYNYHGIVLWRTQKEKTQVDSLEYASMLLFVGGALIAIFKCKVPFRSENAAPTLKLPKEFASKRNDYAAAFRWGQRVRALFKSLHDRDNDL